MDICLLPEKTKQPSRVVSKLKHFSNWNKIIFNGLDCVHMRIKTNVIKHNDENGIQCYWGDLASYYQILEKHWVIKIMILTVVFTLH
jgi:hypothetical protein